jgi:formylglycine-generating enzyme required for sulfatase activity
MEGVIKDLLKALFSVFGWGYRRYQDRKAARDLAPYFNYQEVQEKRKLFIETKWQNISPTKEEEPGFSHRYVTRDKLIAFFINKAFDEKKMTDKYYLVLADSGMGKTTFLVNLFVRYNSFFNRKRHYALRYIPFASGDVFRNIRDIDKEEAKNTILLLDAFDEYAGLSSPEKPDALLSDERFRKVLDELIDSVKDFREVVITSRTQYFPGQEDEPYVLKIPRYSDAGFHTLAKMYLSPFDSREIDSYLNRKYGLLPCRKKKSARAIIDNSPNLMVRPMLLSHIGDFVESGQRFDTTYRIYQELVESWINRECRKREPRPENQETLRRSLHTYSQQVALEIYRRKKKTNVLWLSREDAVSAGVETGLEGFQMTGQSLLTRDGADKWKFAHKSIFEYFIAKEVLENPDFAWEVDFTGMDMTALFCKEQGFVTSLSTINYVLIRGDQFLMGSPESEADREDNETQHKVTLSDYYLCQYAVSVGDFKRFVEKSGYRTDAEKENSSRIYDGKQWVDKKGINWRHDVAGNERAETEYNHPVLHVSWNDAVAYCDWLSKQQGIGIFRLPTEAEWEYACRAGTTTPFNTGENLTTDQANYNGNYPYRNYPKGEYQKKTVPVDNFEPNGYGLYNMHGNVWEWCSDWYDKKYYEECRKQGVVENPQGPSSGSTRVLRGGSWYSLAQNCRSAFRDSGHPGYRDCDVGFRLVFVPQFSAAHPAKKE